MKSIRVLLLLLVSTNFLTACKSGSSSFPPTAQWEIIPTLVEISPAEGGWQDVRIKIAFENKTGRFSTPDILVSTNSIITVEEGFSYPVTARRFFRVGLSGSRYTELGRVGFVGDVFTTEAFPPGFRIKGYYQDSYAGIQMDEFYARIAQNTHPEKITIPNYGDVDLKNVVSVDFPGGGNYSPLRKVGDTIEITGKARLTILSFTKETFATVNDDVPAVDIITAWIKLENLSAGYQTSLQLAFFALNDDGIFGRTYSFTHNSDCQPALTVGPAQTIETKVCLYMPSNSKNIRVILTGEANEVYETGY